MAKVYDDQHTAKDEWQKLKGQPFKVRLEYFMQYYGLLTLIVAVLVIAGIMTVRTVLYNSVPDVIAGVFFSEPVSQDMNDSVKEALCNELQLKPSAYHIDISYSTPAQSSYNGLNLQQQLLIARVSNASLDFVVGTEKVFDDNIGEDTLKGGAFTDLREVLSKDTVTALSDAGLLVYRTTAQEGSVPVMIRLPGTRFYRIYGLTASDCFMGVTSTAPHKDAVEALVRLYVLGS